jgi:hypothetical protein
VSEAGAIRQLFEAFDQPLRQAGYLAMGGQIVDASLISAPKQRNTQDEKDAIKAGKAASEDLVGQTGEGGTEGRGRPLDGEDRPARTTRTQRAACRNWRIHHNKPKGKPMPTRTRKANAKKSAVRAKVEHIFAHQKDRMGLFIRTIGQTRAETKISLANLAYNLQRFLSHLKTAGDRISASTIRENQPQPPNQSQNQARSPPQLTQNAHYCFKSPEITG